MERWLRLILLMPEDDYITNKNLAETLGVSNRTVYNDIRQLNQIMKDKGAQLISKPHYAIKLLVTDRGKYMAFLHSLEADAVSLGENTETRIPKIIEKMILSEKSVRMDDLSESLYISRSTLKNDLKKVRTFISDYDLKIDYHSYAEMKICGSEKTCADVLPKSNEI